MRSCHRRVVKIDAAAICCMKLGDSIFRHIFINLYDSREPAPWEMGPNQILSGHQRLEKTDANNICRTGCRHLVFRQIFSSLGDYNNNMRPIYQQIDPNQMTCGHQGLVKTDAITRCPLQRQKLIFRHILISLHDSMAPVRWKVGPNHMRSGHKGLVKTDTHAE